MFNKFVKVFLAVLLVSCLSLSATAYAAETTGDNDMEYLQSIMDMIKEKYRGQISDQQLMEGALKGMFGSMDPYTVYFTQDEASSFLSSIDGTYTGIGVQVEKLGDYVVITKVFPASPAEKAGIIAGDKIVEVGDKSVVGYQIEETTSLIKGPEGTKVSIGILREGDKGSIKIELKREKIVMSPVTYEIRDGIGYIKLDTFSLQAREYFTEALSEMDKQKVDKIVLDLRNNPGGEVSQAVAVAKKFVPKGLITKLDYKSEAVKDQEYYSNLKTPKYKLAVLVNENSASASEIVAGAIQDTKAGTLVGTKTFGKAKVQNMVPLLTPQAYEKYEKQLGIKLVDGYELISKYGVNPSQDEILGWSKITTGEYTTPKGRMIDTIGLTPDVYVDNYELAENIDISSIGKLSVKAKPVLDSEGLDVYNAEKILKVAGYDIDLPDMKLDAKTFNAVKKFQKDSGLFSYGVMDFATQSALNKKLDKMILEIDKQYAKAVEILK